MNPAKKYLGDIIGGSIMLRGSRLIAELLLTEPNTEQWSQKIENENILQKTSIPSAKRFASTMKKRLAPMGKEFLEAVIDADDNLAMQLLLLGTMNDSPILADFMKTVLADAHRTYKEKIENDAWLEFYEERSRVIPELNNFSESSINKMGSNVIKILADANYLSTTRNKILQKVFVQSEVLDWANRIERTEFVQALESGR
jgi:hypothetical protein